MKQYINKCSVVALCSVIITGCADTDIANFSVEKPNSIAEMEYLNEYAPLKSYIDRTTYPNLKLGVGVNVSDFNLGGVVFRLASANFDELTPGNAMKYSSCVAEDGSMDFSEVKTFIEMAKSAELSIYGHTLAWHSQQQNKYLNGLIADKEIEVDPNDAEHALHINTPQAQTNVWDWQIYYMLAEPLIVGQEYTISMRTKASTTTEVAFWPNNADGSQVQYLSNFSIGEEWGTSSITFTANIPIQKLVFSFGKFSGDLYFDDVKLVATGSETNLIANSTFDETDLSKWSKPSWHSYTYSIEALAAGPSTWFTNLVTNSNCESDDVSCYYAKEATIGPKAATFGAAGTGADGIGRAIVVKSADNPTNTHDTQFFVKVPYTFKEGDTYRFTMKVKADKAGTIESQAHNNPGGYLHYSMVGTPSVTTTWQEYTNTGIISASQAGMNTVAFNLSPNKIATTFYFDDISFELEESGNSIPLTSEEKADTLTWAMDRWIKGMMEACGGYVKAWDVVNEPISGGGNDGDGFYELQSATNGDPIENFYWQDYLGNEEYVRKVVGMARKYFAEYGGTPSELKLFVNDYNLESDWDDNKKVKSLVHWIEKWEADGVTKIDGIGTQMHVSCHANVETQKSKEDHVVKMFEILAESGKLVKITELDMGYVDEEGNSVKTADMTQAQHKAMSEYYKFIVKKYFEIIPAAQQYGITQWCITDSPTGSGWRGGEPVGLWDANYNRKHTYAGFADGLAGK
jgi:GH35 family endo-1,4-beta-xylanase